MPDPHVDVLYYRFTSLDAQDIFSRAVPLTGTVGDFDLVLDAAILTVRPRSHFADRDEARDALEPLLRSWEQSAFLSSERHRIRFEYDHSDVLDRQREEGGDVIVYPDAINLRVMAFDAVVTRDNGRYPGPDPQFVATPLTDRLSERLRRVRMREAEVAPTANTVLSVLEREYGAGGRRRRATATALSVDYAILDTMGMLAATEDPDVGRKAHGGKAGTLSADDLWWLQEAMQMLTRRVGELAAGSRVLQLTMADLPALSR